MLKDECRTIANDAHRTLRVTSGNREWFRSHNFLCLRIGERVVLTKEVDESKDFPILLPREQYEVATEINEFLVDPNLEPVLRCSNLVVDDTLNRRQEHLISE